jgi:hypothetical protein
MKAGVGHELATARRITSRQMRLRGRPLCCRRFGFVYGWLLGRLPPN